MQTNRSTGPSLLRRAAHGLAVAVLVLQIGCASTLQEGQLAAFEPMSETVSLFARNGIVCYPTAVGNAAGGLVGAPLALATFPFVWPATFFTEDDDYLFQTYGTIFWGPVLFFGGATGGLFYGPSLLLDGDEPCDFGTEPAPSDEGFMGD